jgi:hypothetical protein
LDRAIKLTQSRRNPVKKLLAILALSLSLPTLVQASKPTTVQKLVLVETVVALAVGPIVLPAAILTGQREALCTLMEPKGIPTSYNLNSDGLDQCPRGNWLRLIPFLPLFKEGE